MAERCPCPAYPQLPWSALSIVGKRAEFEFRSCLDSGVSWTDKPAPLHLPYMSSITLPIDMVEYDRPAMAFYPFTPEGEGNNWWAPNVQCVIDMLRAVGFSRIEHVAHPLYHTRAFFHAFTHA